MDVLFLNVYTQQVKVLYNILFVEVVTFNQLFRALSRLPHEGNAFSEKLFPVHGVTAQKASREVGIFFFTVFNFSLTRMYQED